MIIKWIYYYECWNFEDEEGTSDLIEYSLVNDGGGKRSIFVTSFCKIGTISKLISVFSNTIQVAQNFLSHIDLTGLQLQIAILSLGLKIVLSYMIFLVIWNLKPGHLAKKVAKIRTVTWCDSGNKWFPPWLCLSLSYLFIYFSIEGIIS